MYVPDSGLDLEYVIFTKKLFGSIVNWSAFKSLAHGNVTVE